MPIIVQKYGGSSVADINKINKIAGMIAALKKTGADIAVVVSAMGKTTDSLIEMAKNISDDPPKREMDMLLSTGERITMSLLCIALNKLGINSISLTGSQSGIITNDRHNDARVIEVRPFRVLDEMESGKVVVVGGFQGVSYKRDITTLGRGGSDTTAVALAAALNAERCEIYSDVDGVYSADPSVISGARHLPEISYEQMQEMSEAGAKVLNSQAVQFAKESNIAVYARSTFNPGRETVVRKLPSGLAKGVKAVVHESDLVRITVTDEVESNFGLILEYLDEKGIKIKELNSAGVPGGSSKITFLVQKKSIMGWDKFIKELTGMLGEKIRFDYDLGAVSLIGDGINNDNMTLKETLSLLSENGIKVNGVTTTSFRISVAVPAESLKQAAIICHHKWIEEF